jgi:hypothetical protein
MTRRSWGEASPGVGSRVRLGGPLPAGERSNRVAIRPAFSSWDTWAVVMADGYSSRIAASRSSSESLVDTGVGNGPYWP